MSYFGTALKQMLDAKNMKAVRLAELSGVSQPTISRYIRGDQGWVSPDDLEKMASAISDRPVEQAELIKARLLDECHGPGSEMITISIADQAPARENQGSYGIRLPSALARAMEIIGEYVIKDANVREIVLGLGNLLEPSDSRVAAAAQEIEEMEREEISSQAARADASSTSKKAGSTKPAAQAAEPKATPHPPKAPVKYHPPARKRTSNRSSPGN